MNLKSINSRFQGKIFHSLNRIDIGLTYKYLHLGPLDTQFSITIFGQEKNLRMWKCPLLQQAAEVQLHVFLKI